MYLRRSTRHKNGKAHDYWRLVRSVRRGSKVVQETVAQLGELDAEGRARAKVLARQITGGYVQASLFDEPSSILESARIRVDRVRLERGRAYGSVWLAWTIWQALRLDDVCAELLRNTSPFPVL